MHITDIERAIAAGDTPGIRRGFRALACYPDGEKIVGGTVENLRAAAVAVADACVKDFTFMPGATSALLSLLPGGSYAAGAMRLRLSFTKGDAFI